jgi:hypothetical protein
MKTGLDTNCLLRNNPFAINAKGAPNGPPGLKAKALDLLSKVTA